MANPNFFAIFGVCISKHIFDDCQNRHFFLEKKKQHKCRNPFNSCQNTKAANFFSVLSILFKYIIIFQHYCITFIKSILQQLYRIAIKRSTSPILPFPIITMFKVRFRFATFLPQKRIQIYIIRFRNLRLK